MNRDPVVKRMDNQFYSLMLTSTGKTLFELHLTPEQKCFAGQKISPFLCWKTHNLCRLNLSRVHLTCFTCIVRKVVTGQLSRVFEIEVRQVWSLAELSSFRKSVNKGFLSLAEMSGH
jgi:hypothetical protein